MIHGANWTGPLVLERLVAFFVEHPYAALRAETGDLFPTDPKHPLDGLDIVRATLRVLGPQSIAAKRLLARARGKAKALSVAELCRETGDAPATFNRWVDLASKNVAIWLNWREGKLLPLHRDGGELVSDQW
jgi:hypothetical protein